MARQDITLRKGDTLDVTLDSPELNLLAEGCDLEMALRITHGGRVFARLTSSAGQIAVGAENGDTKVSLYARALSFIELPAINYIYDIYAQCSTAKIHVASGFFDLQPSTVHTGDLDDVLTPTSTDECEGVVAPAIASLNESLSLCCQTTGEPLYFEVASNGRMKEISATATFGYWRVERWARGAWRAGPAQSPIYQTDGQRPRGTASSLSGILTESPRGSAWDWGKWTGDGMWGGGSSCDECASEVPKDDFTLTINATDVCGNTTSQSFFVDVSNSDEEGTANDGSISDDTVVRTRRSWNAMAHQDSFPRTRQRLSQSLSPHASSTQASSP